MTEDEKQQIRNEIFYYKKILEIHSRNKEKIWNKEKEYQNYVDDILDELIKLRKILEQNS